MTKTMINTKNRFKVIIMSTTTDKQIGEEKIIFADSIRELELLVKQQYGRCCYPIY